MNRGLVGSLAALAALTFSTSTAMAATHHRARPAVRCARGHVKKRVRVWEHRGHRRVHIWVTRCVRPKSRPKPAAVPSPTITYKTAVDPSFTQDAHNPLAVTYAYSATAIATLGTTVTNLATTGQLPAGVLNFYSASTPGGPEQLDCSINVGAAVIGGNCPITYQQTGTYNVTTEYIPNAASAVTETDVETISPFTTTTVLTLTSGACQSAPTPSCAYQLTSAVTDQNGNHVGPQILLTADPGSGHATQSKLLPANGSCSLQVTSAAITSSDCNFEDGTSVPTQSWTMAATYPGSTGWAASAPSAAVTLTP